MIQKTLWVYNLELTVNVYFDRRSSRAGQVTSLTAIIASQMTLQLKKPQSPILLQKVVIQKPLVSDVSRVTNPIAFQRKWRVLYYDQTSARSFPVHCYINLRLVWNKSITLAHEHMINNNWDTIQWLLVGYQLYFVRFRTILLIWLPVRLPVMLT